MRLKEVRAKLNKSGLLTWITKTAKLSLPTAAYECWVSYDKSTRSLKSITLSQVLTGGGNMSTDGVTLVIKDDAIECRNERFTLSPELKELLIKAAEFTHF